MAHGLISRFGIGVAAIAAVSACGSTTTGSAAPSAPSPSPSSTAPAPAPTRTSSPTGCPSTLTGTDVPTLDVNGFDTVKLGMTKAQAAATCYFNVDVRVSEPCPHTIPLQFKAPYTASIDVYVDASGRLRNMGIWGRNVRMTMNDIGIGSTYADLRSRVASLSAPRSAGYDQTGVFVHEGQNYLGFLFNAKPQNLKGTDTVTFMELQQGSAPGLMRDGC